MSDRDAILELLNSAQHAPMDTHDGRTGECMSCPVPLYTLSPEEIADAIVAAGWIAPIDVETLTDGLLNSKWVSHGSRRAYFRMEAQNVLNVLGQERTDADTEGGE